MEAGKTRHAEIMQSPKYLHTTGGQNGEDAQPAIHDRFADSIIPYVILGADIKIGFEACILAGGRLYFIRAKLPRVIGLLAEVCNTR